MTHLNKLILLIAIPLAIFLGSCSNEEIPQSTVPQFKQHAVNISTGTAKKETPRYIYKGDRFRDPFIPLTDSGYIASASDSLTTPSVGSLSLKGIVNDGSKRIAIISGGGTAYILRDGKLFDSKNRQIKNMYGTIKKDSVVLTGADKTSKELSLRPKQ